MKQKGWLWKAAVTSVMALSILIASPGAFGMQTTAHAKSSEDQLDDLRAREKALEKQLSDLGGQIDDLEKYLEPLQEKISVMQDQLDVLKEKVNKLNKQISAVETQINTLEKQIQAKQAELDQQYAAFSQRMETIYRTGAPSKIEAFLSATDFSDFLIQAEMISNVTEEDNAIMESMKKQMNEIQKSQAELQKQKASLDRQKKELEASKAEQEKKQREVQADVDEANKKLKELAAKTGKAGDLLSANREEQDRIEAEIQDKINNSDYTEGDGNVTGNMMWPMPGYSYITTYFNQISGFNGRRHGGIDIAGSGINGKNIRAADGGTVITAEWHYSYGNYVMIDHHNGLVTLYAHSQKLLVREGQAVTKGQAIALVGSTGESSGPHLHFEVRKNGTRVNPFNYVHY